MTLIHTAELHGENPFAYLTALLRNAKAVAANPANWLPWNYCATLASLRTRAGPVECTRAPAIPSTTASQSLSPPN